jgi:hypothetical protein
MRVGFTGTQKGMTNAQHTTIWHLLGSTTYAEAHHGDCIGADATFHAIASEIGIPVVIHPPNTDAKRAFCKSSQTMPPKPYLVRNHEIVDSSDVLIATPKGFVEELRSGTWATIRYARKQGKRVFIVFPSGGFEDDSER